MALHLGQYGSRLRVTTLWVHLRWVRVVQSEHNEGRVGNLV